MSRSGKLLNDLVPDSKLITWAGTFPEISSNELICGQGFYQSDLEEFFPDFLKGLLNFFKSFTDNVRLERVIKQAQYPQDLVRVVPFEHDNEKGVLGIDLITEEVLAKIFSPKITEDGLDLAIEYFETRILGMLSKKSTLAGANKFYYLDNEDAEQVEVVAAIGLEFVIEQRKVCFWFGLGKELLKSLSKSKLIEKELLALWGLSEKNILSVVLDDLLITPSQLIDYTRTGNIIDLELVLINKVKLRQQERDIAEVELFQAERNLICAVKKHLTEINRPTGVVLSIELMNIEISLRELQKNLQEGLIFILSNISQLKPCFSIKGEKVADVELYQKDNNLMVKVL